MKRIGWLATLWLLGCAASPPPPAEPLAEPAPVQVEARDAVPSEPDTLVESGPSRATKREQCDRFIHVINVSGREIKKALGEMNAGDDIALVARVGDVMDGAASEVERVELTDPTLTEARDEYEKVLRTSAMATRAMAAAVKANDLPGLNKALEGISNMETTEAELAKRVNGYCSDAASPPLPSS